MCNQDKIIIKDVCYHYPRQQTSFRLKNINLTLSPASFTILSGPNGSGKTTLGKLMVGILHPLQGQVLLLGEDTTTLSLAECGRRAGYLFQNPARQLFATSVFDELYFTYYWKGVSQKEVKPLIYSQLKQFGLDHLSKRAPHTLSRGEQQRLAIAAIMLHQPRFLILDEPTSSLDPERKQQLGNVLENLKQQGTGIIVITHDASFIDKHADQIIHLTGGITHVSQKKI